MKLVVHSSLECDLLPPRRRLTSVTDVQPQSSFDDDENTPSYSLIEHGAEVDRGYHTDPCIVTIHRKSETELRSRGSALVEPFDSTESSEESYEDYAFQQLLLKGAGLERNDGCQAALAFYHQALQQGVFEETLNIAHLEYKIGTLLWKRGSYEKSLKSLKRSLRAFESEGGLCVRIIAEICFLIGRNLNSLGNRRRARKYYMKALRTLEFDQFVENEVRAEDQVLYANILVQVASLLVVNGSYEMASSVLGEAITLQRHLLGPEHSDIARTLLVYGSLNEALRQYEYAAKCYLDALDIFGNDTSCDMSSAVDISVTLSNVGWLFYLTENYASSLRSYEEALQMIIPVLGEDHRNVASLRVHVGMVHAQQGNLKTALKTYRRALKSQRSILGDDHEDVALTLALVGSAYKQWGKHIKAVEFLQHALSIRQKVLEFNSVVVGCTFVELGVVYMEMGELSHASYSFSEALAIFHENGVPLTDTRVVEARECLSMITTESCGTL